jgi:microcystin degradation protein MlrC
MPAQFDMNAARVANLAQRRQHRPEINLAFAEQQMIVNAAAHVLNVDIPQQVTPVPQIVRDGFALTVQMADVQSQAENRPGHAVLQLGEAAHVVYYHPRFRLKGQADAARLGEIAQGQAAVGQAGQQDRFAFLRACCPRPEAQDISTQVLGDHHGSLEVVEPAPPALGIGTHQSRLMLVPGVKQKAGPGFHHAAQLEFVQQPAYHHYFLGQFRAEGIKGVPVQGDCRALIAQVRQDAQGVFQAVVGKAIGVVAKEHEDFRMAAASKHRIAIAGFMHESNTFNPIKADRSAFAAQTLTFGPAFAAEWRDAHHEVGGFLEEAATSGDEPLPLVMAWATPSGPVSDAVLEEVTAYLIREIERQHPDGLLLALHGAMVTESHPDGDGEVLARLRRALGRDFPIVITLDLHGNLSERLIELSDAAVAYRTCPHVDQRECGRRAAALLRRMLHGEIRPRQALAKPPLIVNIMTHDTSEEPLHSFMQEARQLERQPGILAVSLLPGFAYADVPQMGPAVVVVTDNDADLARHQADLLADRLWQARDRLSADLPGPAETVAQALRADRLPVVLVDTGDNVGGGSAGDGTVLLAEMLRQGATGGVVCLYAPDEVRQCAEAGVGSEVRLTVGGKVDRLHGEPLTVTGRVRLLHDGTYVEPEVRHGGKRVNHMGRSALVELEGENLLVLNSLRHPPFSLGQLTCLGIRPEQQRLLVVKAAIAYKAAYGPIAGTIIPVDTPGLTAVNPRRFAYRHIRRPMFPLD